jgi:hypothetical protein
MGRIENFKIKTLVAFDRFLSVGGLPFFFLVSWLVAVVL